VTHPFLELLCRALRATGGWDVVGDALVMRIEAPQLTTNFLWTSSNGKLGVFTNKIQVYANTFPTIVFV